jgi:SAM-dependent methyltransferase
MFAAEPQRAIAEIHRVLRPTGRATIAVWGPQAANPWLGVVFDAVTAVTGFPVPPPGIPGPFALADEARLHEMFSAAGFDDVVTSRLPTPLHASSFEAWWARTRAIAGPLSAMLARLDSATNDALEARLRAAVAAYTTPAGLDLPGLTLLVSARRP